MVYNMDFLIAAMVILLLILWDFLGQKRADDLNNQIFLFFAVLGILDVAAELLSNYYISSGGGDFGLAAMLTTTVFYLFQALLPFTLICYIVTLHDNKMISAKKMLLPALPTFFLIGLVLLNPFTEKLFYFDLTEGYVEGSWYKLMYYSAICHMAAAFIRIMDEFGIPHDWIQFEITETVATEYNGSLKKVADDFTAAGVRLCLDDFGSGYANLNTVMQLPFSSIKLDRSLLFDICSDEKRALFYQSVVETFRRMNYRIVAEGVETEAEMRLLSSWNVDMIQGYYFSKPLPQKELLELLKQSYT